MFPVPPTLCFHKSPPRRSSPRMGRCSRTHCHASCTRARNSSTASSSSSSFSLLPPPRFTLLRAATFLLFLSRTRARATSPPLSAFLCGSRPFCFYLPSSFLPSSPFLCRLALCLRFASSPTPFSSFFRPSSPVARGRSCNAPLLLCPRRNYRVLRFASGSPCCCRAYRWSTLNRGLQGTRCVIFFVSCAPRWRSSEREPLRILNGQSY